MKKRFLWLFLMLITITSFSIKVDASAPRTLKAGGTVLMPDYVSGYPVYWKSTEDKKHELFCEVANLPFPSGKTITRVSKADKGFAYIIKNKPNTWSGNRDYYVTQMAVWWYKDILAGGNSNLDANFKSYCQLNRNSHDQCRDIVNLVEGARKYSGSKASMVFSSGTVRFTETRNYFISDVITFSNSNLSKFNGLKLIGAPTGSTITNIKNYDSYSQFQIRVNKNSITEGKTYNFKVEATGTYTDLSVYDYYYASGYQKVLYDVVYTKNKTITESKSISLYITPKKVVIPPTQPTVMNSLTIEKVDQNGKHVRNAELTLYYGNCSKSTCYSKNVFSRWTTSASSYKIYDLPTGYYTVVETRTPSGYQTAEKGLIYIGRNDRNYKYTVINKPEVKIPEITQPKPTVMNSLTIEKVDQNGRHIRNAELTLYYGNCTKSTCYSKNVFSRWTTSASSYKIYDLPIGYYTVVETRTPKGYQTAEKGLIYIARNDIDYKYTVTNIPEIKVKPVVISKTDVAGNKNIQGATLVIKDSRGFTVETFVSTVNSKEIYLNEGYYTLQETKAPNGYKLNTTVVYFHVDKEGNTKIRNASGSYISVNEIILTNSTFDMVNISKLDKNTNNYLVGAVLEVKDEKGSTVASWTTTNQSHNLTLKPGVYTVSETYTPKGYLKNTDVITFKLLEDGSLMIKNSSGNYMNAAGIIIYNVPEEEYEVITEVPKTGLSSTLTYVMGSVTLAAGAWVLYRNEKYSI